MTMELFATQHPEVELHIYGERMGRLPFRCRDHRRVSPEHLNRNYNQCFAGLSLSLTNVSLVPHEMLAAWCIAVVNDAEQNRMARDNPFIRYAEAYPQALVNELSSVVGRLTSQLFPRLRHRAYLAPVGSTRALLWTPSSGGRPH